VDELIVGNLPLKQGSVERAVLWRKTRFPLAAMLRKRGAASARLARFNAYG